MPPRWKTPKPSPGAINNPQDYNDCDDPLARSEDHAVPIHDWTRVAAEISHDFHHEWISTINRFAKSESRGH
jgi:hypothetical protein